MWDNNLLRWWHRRKSAYSFTGEWEIWFSLVFHLSPNGNLWTWKIEFWSNISHFISQISLRYHNHFNTNNRPNPKQLSNRLWKSLLHTIPSQLHFDSPLNTLAVFVRFLILIVLNRSLTVVNQLPYLGCVRQMSNVFFWATMVLPSGEWPTECGWEFLTYVTVVRFTQTTTFDCLLYSKKHY